jgi:hypothetical protein
MNHAAGNRSVSRFTASVAVAATFSHEIDTAGYKYASIDVIFSPYTASNVTIANVLKVMESDTAGSGQVDVPGLRSGTDFTVAATGASTGAQVGAVARFNVDLRGRRRYLTVTVTPSTTVAVVSNCRLSKAEAHATTASEAGVNQFVNL